jgi:hypothetical protein
MLDFPLRTMAGGRQQPFVVIQREMRPQQCDRRERDRSFGDQPENDGKLPGGSRPFDAVIGRVF